MKQLHLGSQDLAATLVLLAVLAAVIGANMLPIPW